MMKICHFIYMAEFRYHYLHTCFHLLVISLSMAANVIIHMV